MPDFQEPIVPVVSPGQVLPPGAGGPNTATSQTSSTADLLGFIRTLASPSASKRLQWAALGQQRFTRGEPRRGVHECVLGARGPESETVYPRPQVFGSFSID